MAYSFRKLTAVQPKKIEKISLPLSKLPSWVLVEVVVIVVRGGPRKMTVHRINSRIQPYIRSAAPRESPTIFHIGPLLFMMPDFGIL